jgi:type IV secretory pathway VirB6-like protein
VKQDVRHNTKRLRSVVLSALLTLFLTSCNAPDDTDCLLPFDYENPGTDSYSFDVYPYNHTCTEACGDDTTCQATCKSSTDIPFIGTGLTFDADTKFSTKVTGSIQLCPAGGSTTYSDALGNFFFNTNGYQRIQTLAAYEEIELEVSGIYAPQRVHYAAWPVNYPLTEAEAAARLCYFAGEETTKPASVDQICQQRYYTQLPADYVDGLSEADRGVKLCTRTDDDPTLVPQGITDTCLDVPENSYDLYYTPEKLKTAIDQYKNSGGNEAKLQQIFKSVSDTLGIAVTQDYQMILGNWGDAANAPPIWDGASVSYDEITATLDPNQKQGVVRFIVPGASKSVNVLASYINGIGGSTAPVSGYQLKVTSKGCNLENGRGLIYDVGGTRTLFDAIVSNETTASWIEEDGYKTSTFGTASGAIKLGIEDVSDANYANNSGYYTVSILKHRPPTAALSEVLQFVMDPVMDTLYGEKDANNVRQGGVVQRLYNNTITGPLRHIIQLFTILYATFYAFGFVAGFIKFSQYDFIVRVIRLLLVFTMFSDQSWDFFSTHLFNIIATGIVDLSTAFSPLPANMQTGTVEDFVFLDRITAPLMEGDTWLRITALMLNSFYGLLIAAFIILGILMILVAVVRGALVFVFANIGIALMLSIAPVFFTFMLFEATRKFFNSWFKLTFSLMLQPVMVFVVIVIFSELLLATLYQTLSFSACWQCIWRIFIPTSEIGSGVPNVSICLMNFYEVWGDSDASLESLDGGLPVTIIQVVIFLIFAHMLTHFVDWATSVSAKITGGFGSNMGVAAKQLGGAMKLDKLDDTLKKAARRSATALPRKVGRDGLQLGKAGGNMMKAKLNEKAGQEDSKIGRMIRAKDRGVKGAGNLAKAAGAFQMMVGTLAGDKDRVARGAEQRMKGQAKRNERHNMKDPEYRQMQQERKTQERLDRASEQRDKAKEQYKSSHTTRLAVKGVKVGLSPITKPVKGIKALRDAHKHGDGAKDLMKGKCKAAGHAVKSAPGRGVKAVGHKAKDAGHGVKSGAREARGKLYSSAVGRPFRAIHEVRSPAKALKDSAKKGTP